MRDIISIIQTEQKKIWKKKSNLILLLALVALCIAFGMLNHSTSSSKKTWRADLQKELESTSKSYVDLVENSKDSPEALELFGPIYEENIAIYSYALDHNIPYNVNSAWTNVYNSTLLMNLVLILLLIIVITNFTSEYQFGTIKQLLTTSISRSKWLYSKYLAYVLLAILFLCLQFLASLAIGFLLDGFASPITLEYQNGAVIEVSILTSLLHQYLFHFLFIIVFILIAECLAVLTQSTIATILGSLFVWFGNTILGSFLSEKPWYKYTFFPHIGSGNYMENGLFKAMDGQMAQSLTTVGIYILLLTFASFVVFQKKDI